MRHLHLDPMGGVAGDMFIACLLDAFPQHAGDVIAAAGQVAPVHCRTIPHRDVLAGLRFEVREVAHGHGDDHGHSHGGGSHVGHSHAGDQHGHAAWRDIRAALLAAPLPDGVKAHATGIFALLAEAEARVHGVAPEAVSFHEVGAADSIADIVGAAWLIDALGPATWSVGRLPLGGGRVRTAHGPMPVPAPATALLLEGFETIDDGIGGERVTPTGAAILRHLGCASARPAARRLAGSGIGFGTRTLPGISNCLRVLVFDAAPDPTGHRELAVIAFEVDDQSGEDLAAGLDRLRAVPGVHDVLQMPAYGKKGRLATHVQLLARPDALAEATAACFAETTTIGLRTHTVHGVMLPRRMEEVRVAGRPVRVKLVERPGGRTGKAESDDLADAETHAARARLRRAAEQAAEETTP